MCETRFHTLLKFYFWNCPLRFFFNLKELFFFESKTLGNKHHGKALNLCVQRHDRGIKESSRRLNLVFCVAQFPLQLHEVLGCLQLGIILCNGKQGLQCPREHVFRSRHIFYLSCLLCGKRLCPRLSHLLKNPFFVCGVSFHRFH